MFKKIATWFENRILNKANKIQETDTQVDEYAESKEKKKSKLKKLIGVFLFVAIPLPLTGVWTGTCIAVFLGLNYLETCTTVVTGNLCAGLITMLVSLIFKDNTIYVLYAFIAIALVLVVYGIIRAMIKAKKQPKTE